MSKNKEQLAFAAFKEASVGVLNLKRIENTITSGQPDTININRKGASFWMELKALHLWPVRGTTPVLKGKFEKGQLSQLREWISWRGHAFVLLRVGKDFFLLDPKLDLESQGHFELAHHALAVGKSQCVEYLAALENKQ